mmetsp:Transcript_17510/g.36577  ORF Transcript_17510/g.36577 Transcript_17510/m.36577 type:complete len:200 (-) Transcript_17510:302-901(-)
MATATATDLAAPIATTTTVTTMMETPTPTPYPKKKSEPSEWPDWQPWKTGNHPPRVRAPRTPSSRRIARMARTRPTPRKSTPWKSTGATRKPAEAAGKSTTFPAGRVPWTWTMFQGRRKCPRPMRQSSNRLPKSKPRKLPPPPLSNPNLRPPLHSIPSPKRRGNCAGRNSSSFVAYCSSPSPLPPTTRRLPPRTKPPPA